MNTIIPMRGMHPASFSFLRDSLSQGGSSNVVPPMSPGRRELLGAIEPCCTSVNEKKQ